MKLMISATAAVLALLLVALPAMGQDLQKGLEAMERDDYATAVVELRPLAKQGLAEAQTLLGDLYVQGRGVPRDSTEAMRWYRLAADQGYAPAQKAVGDLYAGNPTLFPDDDYRCSQPAMEALAPKMEQAVRDLLAKDPSRADDIMKKAQAIAEAGATGKLKEACNLSYNLAEELGIEEPISSLEYAEAVKWYRLAADQGYAPAQVALSGMYLQGDGVPQSVDKGVAWLRQAEARGDATAQYGLGYLYEIGLGVPQDFEEAVRLYTLAAGQWSTDALYRLGRIYSEGLGVPQDYVAAHRWFNLAAAKGHEEAAKERERLGRRMTSADVSEAQRLAREWAAAHS